MPTEFEGSPAIGKSPSTVKGVKVPNESPRVKPANELENG